MTATRCPAAHPEDPTPCDGPPVVTVLDAQGAGADGCEHHAARLLASLDGGRVYPLPDAPDGAAIRTFTAAGTLPPEPWDGSTWKAWTDTLKTKTGVKGRGLFMPLRLALTGLDHGPELAPLMPLIGRDR